jgi:hypothetical protein
VKQEIFKEGFLPFAKTFGESTNLSIGRFLEWLASKPAAARLLNKPLNWKWLSPEEHSQETPVGALFVHWASTMILIGATWGQSDLDAYGLIITLYVFVIDAVFGLLLGLGIIYLRARPSAQWKAKSKPIIPFLSISAAIIFILANLFPLISLWIPPNNGKYAQSVRYNTKWFTAPTVGTSVIGLGVLWWIGFYIRVTRKEKSRHVEYEVQRIPAFEQEPPEGNEGYPVLQHELIHHSFLGRENADGGM